MAIQEKKCLESANALTVYTGTISGLLYWNLMEFPFNVHKTNVDSTKLGKLVKDGLVMA